jgi:hypothetical protein
VEELVGIRVWADIPVARAGLVQLPRGHRGDNHADSRLALRFAAFRARRSVFRNVSRPRSLIGGSPRAARCASSASSARRISKCPAQSSPTSRTQRQPLPSLRTQAQLTTPPPKRRRPEGSPAVYPHSGHRRHGRACVFRGPPTGRTLAGDLAHHPPAVDRPAPPTVTAGIGEAPEMPGWVHPSPDSQALW